MTDRYAVIGHPIAHSKSPLIHSLFARATGQDMTYEAMDPGATADALARALSAFRAAGGRGVNVTLPFKLDALRLADEASEEARLAGAANMLSFEGGRIRAANTDGIGLVRDITVNLDVPLTGRRVLLMGAGGAARGVLLPLARAGVAGLVVANRTADKARQLARGLAPHLGGVPVDGCGLAALDGHGSFDVLINATSASLDGQAPGLPQGVFASGALAYDMVYGKGQTPFLQLALAAGCARIADGTGMLVEQAAESFAWWRGVRPDTGEARAVLSQGLDKS